MNKKCLTIALSILLFAAAPAFAEPGFDRTLDWIGENVEPIPEYHVSADIRRFFFRRNDFFKEHFFVESTIQLEVLFVSLMEKAYAGIGFDIVPGMGQTPNNVVFDPMDINYSIIPVIEYRLDRATVQAGVDHRCFHQMDRSDLGVVYWNMPYLRFQSPNFRPGHFWFESGGGSVPAILDRIAWRAQWGWFMRKWGDIKPSNINYQNDNVHESIIETRGVLARGSWWGVTAGSMTRFGLWRRGSDNRMYWRQELTLALDLLKERHGWGFFGRWSWDDIPPYRDTPRFSRHGLMELGCRMFL